MTYDPRRGFPSVVPILLYRDVDRAIEWLTTAFGFAVRLRAVTPAGATGHCDLETGSGVIMVEPAPVGFEPLAPVGKRRDFVLVTVDDVDHHHQRAVAAGAEVGDPPRTKPWGLRQYLVHDHEGHTWEFSQFMRDVPTEAWWE